jgi:tryptophan halogenase
MMDGGTLTADLFIDATGPAATLRSALDRAWEDWRRWLPCDRLVMADAPAVAEPAPLDRVVAATAGWRWTSSAPAATSHGLVYVSVPMADEAAARTLRGVSGVKAPGAPIHLSQGTRPQPWLRNCVAIGDAATVIEPLEWTNLHLAHSAIDRIVAMMPGRACAPVEIADYNRQTVAEVDRVRDFVVCHYATSRRPEPFWQEVAAVEPPASLAYTLSLFAERGRLPFFEEETFAKDSWLAVLIGQGVIPRRADPLIDAVPPFQSDQAMAGYRAALAAAVSSFPTPSAFMAAQQRQIAR